MGPEAVGYPDCVPDTFFDASSGDNLKAQINAAINDILKQAASGTSISVLASSSSGDGTIYQAFFYPNTPGQNNNKLHGLAMCRGSGSIALAICAKIGTFGRRSGWQACVQR